MSSTAQAAQSQFESLVQRIVQTVGKDKLADLRKDFHTRLRITLTHPEQAELIEDIWDFFYDWCVFDQKLPDIVPQLGDDMQALWLKVKDKSERGLYSVQKVSEDLLKLKELYTGKSFNVEKKEGSDFVGIEKGDILETRLVAGKTEDSFYFARKPSFHPTEVHPYIKKKIKGLKKLKDFSTYQSWLWLLVGMYLKHRLYQQMPIDKIYDDNSRI